MHKLLNAIIFLAISNLHPIIIQQGYYAITRLLTMAGTQNNYQLRIETIRIEQGSRCKNRLLRQLPRSGWSFGRAGKQKVKD